MFRPETLFNHVFIEAFQRFTEEKVTNSVKELADREIHSVHRRLLYRTVF
jgi:hypothetical protein